MNEFDRKTAIKNQFEKHVISTEELLTMTHDYYLMGSITQDEHDELEAMLTEKEETQNEQIEQPTEPIEGTQSDEAPQE